VCAPDNSVLENRVPCLCEQGWRGKVSGWVSVVLPLQHDSAAGIQVLFVIFCVNVLALAEGRALGNSGM